MIDAKRKNPIKTRVFEWWRRGDSNPRPRKLHVSVYVRIPLINLARNTANGQAMPQTSVHEIASPLSPVTQHQS